MALDPQQRTKLAKLKDDLKQRDEKIAELREELRKADELVAQMRERLEDNHALIENWIEVFEMQQGDDGLWLWDPKQTALWDQYGSIINKWNRFVPRYNATIAPRDLGRPLAASEAQVADVLARRKARASLRAIASATSLSLRTVRSIVDRKRGADPAAKRKRAKLKLEHDKLRAAAFRARKKQRDALPKRISEAAAENERLIRTAKGLDEK